jgi:hypothetical protein
MRTAREAGREVALNRRLIERLAAWNQKEARVLFAPLFEGTGYQAEGSVEIRAPRPALLDKRG